MNTNREIKNVMIFGDSYSTFSGFIPEGYAVYYSKKDAHETGVNQVDKTWWRQLFDDMNFNLVRNDSWSGSTIGYTGYSGDCSGTSSFICRLEKLRAEGFFDKNEIDTVFIFGGTNDSWVKAPVGEVMLSGHKREDLFTVLPAIGYFVSKLKETLPKANIFFIINTKLSPEIDGGIKLICEHSGVPFITLKDIDKRSGHPTALGMTQIKEQVKDFLLSAW